MMHLSVLLLCSFGFSDCKKEEKSATNLPPLITALNADLVGTATFDYRFTVEASDQEFATLTYQWDFGDGQKQNTTTASVNHTFAPNGEYIVKVGVSDGVNTTEKTTPINTKGSKVTVEPSKTFQTMVGFGGFGAQNVYWSNGPFVSQRFVDDVVKDLGCTILRDELPPGFERVNDNNDPAVTDLSKFNLTEQPPGEHQALRVRFECWKQLRAAGVEKFIVTVWSPPAWMKWNNALNNGTTNQNSAPPYNRNPNATSNQLKVENYAEYAEFCAAFCKVFEREMGFPLYAFGIQNEPRFSQFYNSCIYDGAALRDLLKVVGKRFKDDGLTTKIFAPEDVGWLGGVEGMTLPIMNDPEARQYLGINAVHGYALDGITAGSADAKTWETMYNWGAAHNIPLWMTETSGYNNNATGGLALAKAMYTALRFGRAEAWVFWTISTDAADSYSLMDNKGNKGRSYYVSKQFYRYIRPGAVRVEANAENVAILPLAFKHKNSETVVLVNTGTSAASVSVIGIGAGTYKVYRTSAMDNCKEVGTTQPGTPVIVPGNGVVTLYIER